MHSTVIAISIAASVSFAPAMAQNYSQVPNPSSIDVSPACQPSCDAFNPEITASLNGDTAGPVTFAKRDFAKGIELLEKGEFARAAKQLTKAANREKDNAIFQYWAGGSYYLAGDTQSAEAFLGRALEVEDGLSDGQMSNVRQILAELQAG